MDPFRSVFAASAVRLRSYRPPASTLATLSVAALGPDGSTSVPLPLNHDHLDCPGASRLGVGFMRVVLRLGGIELAATS